MWAIARGSLVKVKDLVSELTQARYQASLISRGDGILLGSIDTSSLIGLRDRALIALMGYTFARVGAAVSMKVEDYYVQKRRGWCMCQGLC